MRTFRKCVSALLAGAFIAPAAASWPAHAHMSDECVVHVIEMEERSDETAGALADTRRLTEASAEDGKDAMASEDMDLQLLYFARLVTVQLPETFESFMRYVRSSTAFSESAAAAVICAMNETGPEIQPEPERVTLGLDCNPGAGAGDAVAYTVSLPDDVLTECE